MATTQKWTDTLPADVSQRLAKCHTGKAEEEARKMKLVVYTTNNYPHYSKQEITVTEANAMKEFERLSHELKQKANSGELQDYEIELNKR